MSAADTRECPFCAETIKAAALLCRFCGRELPSPVSPAAPAPATPPAPPAAGGAGAVLHEAELLELLTALVQKSLVVYEEDEEGHGRYRLLETVRQYSRDRLLEGGKAEAVRGRHRDWYLALAEQEPQGESDTAWLDQMEREHDNLRAALAWSGAQGQGEAGLRLGRALAPFWWMRGYLGEGREHLARLLALPGAEAPTASRGKALNSAGILARYQGDYAGARSLHEESLAIFRGLGDKHGIAWSVFRLAETAHDQGDYGAARTLFEESLAIFRERGDRWSSAWSLTILGEVVHNEGDSGAARALLEESLAIFRELGVKEGIARSLGRLGRMAGDQGNYGTARGLLEESLAINQELGYKREIAASLERLAGLAVAQAQPERAVCLFGAAEGLREAVDAPLPPAERVEHDRFVAAARTALGAEAFAAAWAEGQGMGLRQAVEYAMEPEGTATGE